MTNAEDQKSEFTATGFMDTVSKIKFDLNSSKGIKLLEHPIKPENYLNRLASANEQHLKTVTNNTQGNASVIQNNNLVHL